MKVLWVTGEYPPDVGGIATMAQQTLRALESRGVETHALICGRGDSDGLDGAITLTRRPILESIVENDAAAIARWVSFVRQLKLDTAADVYHVHPADPSVLVHLLTLSAHPAPTVVTFHQQMFSVLPGATPESLMGRLIAQAQVITAVSAASANEAIEALPGIADRILVIPNGIAVGKEPVLLPNSPEILAVGRLVPAKGFHDLIRSMSVVVASLPRAHLTIVGDGPEGLALRQLSDQLGLAESITFTGAATPDEVRTFMDSSAIVAIPSTFEGMPMVALEAAERGRAVVGSNVGGINEVVLDGATGVLVNRDEHFIENYAKALSGLLCEPVETARLGKAARERMESRQSVEHSAQLYEIVYRAVSREYPAPLVSVIMPTRNGARHVIEAIASVLAQTLGDLELIIVDDGSSDATLEVLSAVEDSRLVVVPQPHRGTGSTRNSGVAIARGEYIAHIDHDDVWPLHRLERLAAKLVTHPELDASFGAAVEFADPSAKGRFEVRTEPTITRFTTTGLIRAAFHRKVGPFHRLPFGDQVDWTMRALGHGMRYEECTDLVLRRRIHDSNMSHRNPQDKDLSKLRLLKRTLDQRKIRAADEA